MSSRSGLLAVLLAALLALSACATGSSDSAAPQAENTEGAFPVTLRHAFGETTIEAPPERVVALGVVDADPLLALGITPVAVAGYQFYESRLGPWAEPLVEGPLPQVIESDSQPSVEQIAALAPDLILAESSGIEEPVYRQLSQIAPTVARGEGVAAYIGTRDDRMRTIAQAVGRVEDGDRLIAQTQERLAAARSANPEFEGKVGTVVLPFDGQYGAFTPGDPRGGLLADLGFVLPPEIAERDTGASFFVEVSREQVGLFDGDVLLMLTGGEPERRAQVDNDPLLPQVPVVRAGGMVIGDLDVRGSLSYNSVLSVPYALDRLVPQLETAVQR